MGNLLSDLSRFVVAERIILRAGCKDSKWWVHFERHGWVMGRGSGDTLITALDDAIDCYLRRTAIARERA